MDKNRITKTHVREFSRGLDNISSVISGRTMKSVDATTRAASTRDLQQSSLYALNDSFAKATESIVQRAQALLEYLRNEWKENPRICNESLLRPLALLNKEVPLTHAIAWLISPSAGKPEASTHTSTTLSLHKALLAALLEVVLGRSINAAIVSDWTVDAEKYHGDEGIHGRFDIFLTGNIDTTKYLIALEAKVNASEGKDQLNKYENELRRQVRELKKNEKKEHEDVECCIVFLTRHGRASKTAKSISYADVLKKWIPVLKMHPFDPSAPFARLLMADIARDLANMHIGDQLSGRNGLPMFVD